MSKTELDKSIKQLVKKPDLLKQFFRKFQRGYLQKIDPGFDLLFHILNSLITVEFDQYKYKYIGNRYKNLD